VKQGTEWQFRAPVLRCGMMQTLARTSVVTERYRPVRPAILVSAIGLALVLATSVRADDKLLAETVNFTGTVLFLQSRVPALVLGAVRKGETAVFGFGETADGSGKAPDGDTMLRIASLSKAFTGQVLASLVAGGTVRFTDRLQDRIGWNVTVPARNGRQIRLIELATHSSGLPRELEREPGPPDHPFSTLTPEAYGKALASDPLLFPPGTGALYSNFAFDVLGAALAHAAGKPYDALLAERVLAPAGLRDTVLALRAGDRARLLQGHDFDGKALPDVKTPLIAAGASGIYSTPTTCCAGCPGTSTGLRPTRRRSACSTTPLTWRATGSIPSTGSTSPAAWTRWASAGSSWRRAATARSFCRRPAACRGSSPTPPSRRRAASASSSRSTSSTSPPPWRWPAPSTS
jgi:Beta-lactamase